jgi:hypothetical protein
VPPDAHQIEARSVQGVHSTRREGIKRTLFCRTSFPHTKHAWSTRHSGGDDTVRKNDRFGGRTTLPQAWSVNPRRAFFEAAGGRSLWLPDLSFLMLAACGGAAMRAGSALGQGFSVPVPSAAPDEGRWRAASPACDSSDQTREDARHVAADDSLGDDRRSRDSRTRRPNARHTSYARSESALRVAGAGPGPSSPRAARQPMTRTSRNRGEPSARGRRGREPACP